MRLRNKDVYHLSAPYARWSGDKPPAGRHISREVLVETDIAEASLTCWRATWGAAQTAIIICPGGGYEVVAVAHEGDAVAEWLSAAGVAAFVLRYRVPPPEASAPLEDARAAMRFVRERAEFFGVAADRVGLLGFSAGGHLAGSTGLLARTVAADERPDFLAMIYPVVTMRETWGHAGSARALLGAKPDESLAGHYSLERQVGVGAPPLFLVHARDDELVPVENALALQDSYQHAGADCEAHFYPTGGHGFGLGRSETETTDWPVRLAGWMRARGLIDADSYEKLSQR